jgi:hypothetical protein
MKHAVRRKKRIQRQPVSAAISDALATELWFRLTLWPSSKRLGQQEIITEIFRWYLSNGIKKPKSYLDATGSGSSVTFWLDSAIIDRYRAIARRDRVTKRQVMAAALEAYAHQMIPPTLTRFRRRTLVKMRELYRAQHPAPAITSRG